MTYKPNAEAKKPKTPGMEVHLGSRNSGGTFVQRMTILPVHIFPAWVVGGGLS
jgi:hypothetical protein